MANIQFSFYNRADGAVLSGGAWSAGAPLANLQQTLLSLRARSTDALAASTQFAIDLGASFSYVRLVAIARHTLSLAATYRITAGTTPGASDVYDSGILAVWPAVYLPADLEWEDDNFWTGQLAADEIVGYPISLAHDCGSNLRARHWTIAFTDTGNAAGYVELARLWLGPIWSPQRNVRYGGGFGWEPRSVAEYSLGGVVFSEARSPARVLRVALPMLSETEALGTMLDAQRRLGTDGELWVIPNPDDTTRRFKRDFLARFRKLDPISQFANRLHETSFELEERL
ncbi:MAG: hypothetical protein IT555_21420 [Acetobacteraceae bacterium]|nr:hypothetical protein [Acetobacteraceae bacterium]